MSASNLLNIGTRVKHSSHGLGWIVKHNTVEPIRPKAFQHFAGLPPAVANSVAAGFMAAIYNGDRYPYEIEFDNGYRDVYSITNFTVEPQPQPIKT